jgi:hypothetical protein
VATRTSSNTPTSSSSSRVVVQVWQPCKQHTNHQHQQRRGRRVPALHHQQHPPQAPHLELVALRVGLPVPVV